MIIGSSNLFAVVVTYNRPELLRRCILAIKAQTILVGGIIVVDNNSEIPAQDALFDICEGLHFVRLSCNLGGAGGFHIGLKEAMARGADAAWLMDDDGAPDHRCLEMFNMPTGIATILNALVVDEIRRERLAFALFVSGKGIASVAHAHELAAPDGIIWGVANPFNGTLINRAAYELMGDIKLECFIWGDEVEYLKRALKFGVKVGTAVNAIHNHPFPKAPTVNLGIFGKIKICPSDRAHYHYRNLGFINWNYNGLAKFLAIGIIHIMYLSFFINFREGKKFISYYWDGATNNYKLFPSRELLFLNLNR